MYRKIRSRVLAAISASQGKNEYVLDGVFWVPVSNCSSIRSASSRAPEPRSQELDTDKTSNLGASSRWSQPSPKGSSQD